MNSLRSMFIKKTSPATRVVLFARGLHALYFIIVTLGTMQVKRAISVQLEWTLHVDEIAQAECELTHICQLNKQEIIININAIGREEHVSVNSALFHVRLGATPYKQVFDELSKNGENVKWFASSPTQQQKAKFAAAANIKISEKNFKNPYLPLYPH